MDNISPPNRMQWEYAKRRVSAMRGWLRNAQLALSRRGIDRDYDVSTAMTHAQISLQALERKIEDTIRYKT